MSQKIFNSNKIVTFLKLLSINTRFQIVIITILTVVVYLNIFQNNFAWDDKSFILDWPTIQSLSNIPDLLLGEYAPGHGGKYRPIKTIVLAVDYALWGKNPVGYHFQALIIHVLSTLLVFAIVRKIAGKTLIPFLTGLLFGLHPIHVEAITFITSSLDMVGAVFLLASFYCYIHFRSVSGTYAKRYYLFSLIFFLLAVFTNEITMIIPLFLISYDVILKKRTFQRIKSDWLVYVSFFMIPVLYFYIRLVLLRIFDFGTEVSYPFPAIIPVTVQAIVQYILLLFFPFTLTNNHEILPGLLSFDRDWNMEIFKSQTFLDFRTFLSLGILLGIALVAFLLRKKHSILSFGIVWFFVSILPIIHFVPLPNLIAERYTYIGSFGFCLILAYGASYFYSRKIEGIRASYMQAVILAMVVIVMIFYSTRTIMRNSDWKDSKTLWQKTLEITPQSKIGHHSLGLIYAEAKIYEVAVAEFEKAGESPHKLFTYSNYLNSGILYYRMEKYEQALQKFNKSLEFKKDRYEPYFYMGGILLKLDKINAAKSSYKKAISLNPDYYLSYFELGKIYEVQGRTELAQIMFQKALILAPNNKEVQEYAVRYNILQKFKSK